MFFRNPSGRVFLAPKMSTYAQKVDFWIPFGSTRGPIIYPWRPIFCQKVAKGEVHRTTFYVLGADLRPTTSQNHPDRIFIDFWSIWDGFLMDFGPMLMDLGQKINVGTEFQATSSQYFALFFTKTSNHNPITPQTISLKPWPGGMRALALWM